LPSARGDHEPQLKDPIDISKLSIEVLEEDEEEDKEKDEDPPYDHHDSVRPAPQLDKLIIIGGGMIPNHNQINDSLLNSLLQEQSQIEEEDKTNNIIVP
jgi:hypothetical protein